MAYINGNVIYILDRPFLRHTEAAQSPSAKRVTVYAGDMRGSARLSADAFFGESIVTEQCWPQEPPEVMPEEDRGEIVELYARYAWGLDLADTDLLLSTFADDGCFDHLWQGQARGQVAILKSMDELWNTRQAWWYGRQHLFNHLIMQPLEQGARVRCFFQIIQFNVEYRNYFVFGMGTRDDKLVRRGGRWRFYNIFVNAWTSADQVPWKGERRLNLRPPNTQPPADTRPFFEQSRDSW